MGFMRTRQSTFTVSKQCYGLSTFSFSYGNAAVLNTKTGCTPLFRTGMQPIVDPFAVSLKTS